MTAPDDYGACRDKGHQQDSPNAAWLPILQKMVFSIIEKCTFWLKISLKLRTSFPIFFSFSRKACLRSLKTDVVLRPIANLKALRDANTNPANFVLHEITLIVVKGFSKDLVPFWTARAIHSKKYCHPFEQLWLPVRKRKVIPMTRAIRLLKLSSVWIARAIRLKNSQPFKRLTTFQNHFCPNRLWWTWQKMWAY